MALALARERPRVALAVVALMTLAPLTAETLKPLLAQPHDQVGVRQHRRRVVAERPFDRRAGARALGVLVAPRRLRPLVASLGAAFALVVGCALLILAWHMPSDVIGGYLVAGLWAALAGRRAARRRASLADVAPSP